MKTACFSGHRPEKFYIGGKEDPSTVAKIKSMLYLAVLEAVRDKGYRRFISGMARGVDLWACEVVLKLKKAYPDIELICALPYRDHGKNFRGQDRYLFNISLESCRKAIAVSENYDRDCMRKRNYFMVDHSSLLIAVYSESKSGTGQTIRYAQKRGIDTNIINASMGIIETKV